MDFGSKKPENFLFLALTSLFYAIILSGHVPPAFQRGLVILYLRVLQKILLIPLIIMASPSYPTSVKY